jgi:hypothetical protein
VGAVGRALDLEAVLVTCVVRPGKVDLGRGCRRGLEVAWRRRQLTIRRAIKRVAVNDLALAGDELKSQLRGTGVDL